MSTRELRSLTGQRPVPQRRVVASHRRVPTSQVTLQNQRNESALRSQIEVQDSVPRSEVQVQLPNSSIPLPNTPSTASHGSRASTNPSGVSPVVLGYLPGTMFGKLEAFSGATTEIAEEWIARFEALALANHWSEMAKAVQLASLLEDGARAWCLSLPLEVQHSYELLKEALLLTFKKRNVTWLYEQQLRDRVMKTGESVDSVAFEIFRLCDRLDSKMSDERKISYLVNALPKEYHKPLLSSEVKDWSIALEKIRRQEIVLQDSDRIIETQKKLLELQGKKIQNQDLLSHQAERTSLVKTINKRKGETERVSRDLQPNVQVQEVPVMAVKNEAIEEDRNKFG
jgi:hypothetical protein